MEGKEILHDSRQPAKLDVFFLTIKTIHSTPGKAGNGARLMNFNERNTIEDEDKNDQHAVPFPG
jgi:hypothetical protein